MKRQIAVLLMASLGLLNGCIRIPSEPQKILDDVSRDWNALVTVMQGGRNPLPKATATVSPSPTASTPELTSERAIRAKVNAEILQEMFRVIFVKDPKNPVEFGNWVDTLNQGASLEGVYNGFTHSSVYRSFEMESKGASPLALKLFGQELAFLEMELPARTEFTADSAKPLPSFGQLAPESIQNQERGAAPIRLPSPNPSQKLDPTIIADQYSKLFVTASIFTLKRVLADEALKVIAAKNAESKLKLAEWYAKWVVRAASYQVDFGLVLRNKPDEAFHYQWAMNSSEDRLTWEVLNRIHRVLNAFNQKR